MKITIEGAKQSPNFETLENLMKETMKCEGKFIRIARLGGNVDFFNLGKYECTFLVTKTTPTILAGEEIQVNLEVK